MTALGALGTLISDYHRKALYDVTFPEHRTLNTTSGRHRLRIAQVENKFPIWP